MKGASIRLSFLGFLAILLILLLASSKVAATTNETNVFDSKESINVSDSKLSVPVGAGRFSPPAQAAIKKGAKCCLCLKMSICKCCS